MTLATLLSYQSRQLMERDTWKSINQPTDVQVQRYPQSGNTGSNCAQWTHLTSINTDCVACVLRNSNHEITKGTNSNSTAAMRHLKTIHKVSFYSIDDSSHLSFLDVRIPH